MLNYQLMENGIHYTHENGDAVAIGVYDHKEGCWKLVLGPLVNPPTSARPMIKKLTETKFPSSRCIEWAALLINEMCQ